MPLDCTTYVDDLTETEREARDDLWRWLERFPDRVPALLEIVREGRMDGGCYYGDCRCVVGSLHHPHHSVTNPVVSNDLVAHGYIRSFCETTPIEHFVEPVVSGDTPANSAVMAHLERWIIQWQAESA